jgi:hypothetical protein
MTTRVPPSAESPIFRRHALRSYRFNPRFLLSGLPALTFWVAMRTTATEVAIALSFLSFLAVFQATKGVGAARLLALVSLGVISIGAAVGMVATSERAYLAADPASDLLIAGLFLGSAMVGRPFVGMIVSEAVPGLAAQLDPDHKIYVWLSVGWGLFNLATALIRWQMVTQLSVGEYLLWSRVLAWPIGYGVMVAMGALLIYAARSSRRGSTQAV